MSRLRDLLKKKKVRWALLFVFLVFVVLPIALVCFAWLIDLDWWMGSSELEVDPDFGYEPVRNDDYFENIGRQLKTVKCPARGGMELRDYWKCLWKTSITAEGLKQHERILWENYVEKVNDQLWVMETWLNKTLRNSENETVGEVPVWNRRVRRGADDRSSDLNNYTFHKWYYTVSDTLYSSRWGPKGDDWPAFKLCQQDIIPGRSIQEFLTCLRKIPYTTSNTVKPWELKADAYKHSLDPTYQPSTFPPIEKSDYDQRQFPLLKMTDNYEATSASIYDFQVDFKPLGKEENLDNFAGADPYLDDNWSVYRYKYNPGDTKQAQVGWTYHGQHSPKDWHEMDLAQFYVPLKKNANVKKTAFHSELVQSYPGIGELAESLDEVDSPLDSPLDYRWSKDRGYNVYTRFLLPLLQKQDVEYYKGKRLLDEGASSVSDHKFLSDFANKMEDFLGKSRSDFLNTGTTSIGSPQVNKKFFGVPEDKWPFAKAYFDFINHFFGIDLHRYRTLKKFYRASLDYHPDNLYQELENVRLMLRGYADVVKVQESCLAEMVSKQDYRLEDEKDVQELVDKAVAAGGNCNTAPNASEANKRPTLWIKDTFRLDQTKLKTLYNTYFDRKEARQRYSLPLVPNEFPICKHNEPSPIDIQTDRGRKSSLRDYSFGPAAYRLNRFFMFFPLDGSPLLTVGIVDGERLDGSSVRLTGGAVRGQNLTFQYMHIRFSASWETVGSEHHIDGKGAPMELQMVFTIAGSADSIKYWHVLARVHNQIFQFREKLVIILSVLVDVLKDDAAVAAKIKEENLNQDPFVFEPLAQAAYHFRAIPENENYTKYESPRGYVSVDPAFRFIDFIPKKASKFYTYRGSLSWPPCFGYVIWSVYEQRLYMSKRQFDQFTEIPAYGIQTAQSNPGYANTNFRKFDDIHVAEEHVENLSFDQIENMKRLRTIDRHVLVGNHDVTKEGAEVEEGVVGEEMYYVRWDEDGCAGLSGLPVLILCLCFCICLIF